MYDPTDEQWLPKKSEMSTLEAESLQKLATIFYPDGYVIRPENISDAGIDLTIELAGKRYTNRRINVQLKATEKEKPNTDGSFSKQIERKNTIYLKRSALLGLYVFYIQETGAFYYEWVDEFEETLERTVPHWKSQEKNTLHFNKVLTANTAKELFKRVERHAAYLEQLRSGHKIDKIIESFHESDNQRNYGDIEWSLHNLITIFDGLIVLPAHILVKIPPFSLTATSDSYYASFNRTLYTDNKALFDYFNDLKREENILSRTDGNTINQERLNEILTFLEYNSIDHIAMSANRDNRICVHTLYYHNGCDCEKCSFTRLQWQQVLIKMKSDFNKTNTYEWLRRAYMLLELGKIHEAFKLYKHLAEESLANKKYVSYIMAKFNLVSMLFLIQRTFLKEDGRRMEAEISSIDLRSEIQNLVIRTDVKREVLSVLLWLSESDYFHRLYVEIDLKYWKALHAHYLDQRGGTVSEPHYLKMSALISELTLFSEGNVLHSEYFNGFGVLIHKLVETFLALYGLQNPLSNKPLTLDSYLIKLCILYGDPDKINKLFIRYNVHPIKFDLTHDTKVNPVFTYAKNLFDSIPDSLDYCNQELERDNYGPRDRFNRHIHMIGILVSVMDANADDINQVALRFVNVFGHQPLIEGSLASGLRKILLRKRKVIKLETFVRYYDYLLNSESNDFSMMVIELPYLIKEVYPDYIDSNETTQKNIRSRLQGTEMKRSNNQLPLAYWQIATEELRLEIKSYVHRKLEETFDSDLYYSAVNDSIIPYQNFIDQFISRVPMTDVAKQMKRTLDGYDDFRINNLNKLIHLAYKYNINLKTEAMQKLHCNIPYYEWLMNLDSFDYTKFEPYWILYQPIPDFLTEFKKYPVIGEKIKEFLKTRPNSLLTDVLLKNF